jgi:hypothetical protein
MLRSPRILVHQATEYSSQPNEKNQHNFNSFKTLTNDMYVREVLDVCSFNTALLWKDFVKICDISQISQHFSARILMF